MLPKGFDPEANYCTLSPDILFGANMSLSCFMHDRQYRNEVKIRKTRKEADEEFRDDIFFNYIIADKIKLGFVISRIYYYAARLLGNFTWVK